MKQLSSSTKKASPSTKPSTPSHASLVGSSARHSQRVTGYGKKPDAEQAARRAYDLLRNLPSPGDLRLLRSEVLLGKVLHAEKKDREAAPLLKAAVANAKAVGPRISGIQQQAQSALAELDKESAP